eukprot:COSAG03_NODE_147_length_11582_cov_5.133937_6_plen_61_part_00
MTLCPKMTPMHLHLFQSVSDQEAHREAHHRQAELLVHRLVRMVGNGLTLQKQPVSTTRTP